MDRRRFLGAIGAPLLTAGAMRREHELALAALAAADRRGHPPTLDAEDELLWGEVARAFPIDRSIVNLNSGGCSPASAMALEAMKRHLDYCNKAPPYTLWTELRPQRENVRVRLARAFGADPEELAIVRNASEGLQICQLGIDLRAGDEVLTTDQDYPRMVNTWKQRARREGIVLRQIELPIPCEDDAEVVRRFAAAITDKTRVILISHVINITGQILPVRAVAELARARGIPVIVDGAHSLAHFEFKLSDLGCDYFATSLHKWLAAPIGCGLLYVRREHIGKLWPMQAPPEGLDDDIRKFEEIGTHPLANYLAIAEALTLHQTIGAARKSARLRFLRDTWASRALATGRARLHTSLRPEFSCAVATLELEGIDSSTLANWLWDRHRILVAGIKHPRFQGIRVSANVFTTLDDLDLFGAAIEHAARHGLPG